VARQPSAHLKDASAHLKGVRAAQDEAPASPAALRAGERVDHFRVIAPVGRGGMGVVYRAEDEHLRREVALKVLPAFVSGDVEQRRRLLHEARAAAAVNHPNIASVYQVGEAEGRVYIAMELIRGPSLRKRLDAGRLSLEETLAIAEQILRGLARAHQAGLVHRDLKPDNVMLTEEGVAKVLDFGLAKHLHASPAGDVSAAVLGSRTPSGALFGTPGYMSPEQVQGHALDHRSDLFSFGVLLYEMLAGQSPFKGESVFDLLTAIVREEPAPLPPLNPEVPLSLAQLVERCLAKRPEDRFPDAESLAQELSRMAQKAAVSLSAPTAPSRRESGRPRSTSARPPRKAWLAAGLVALLGIGAAAVLWRPRPAPAAAKAPQPTAITDLPLPSSPSPDAIAAYKAALHFMRSGDWGGAHENLQRAISLDPLMAAAHLRLALSLDHERDQVLLQALEPLLGHTPSDRPLTARRLREATERYPLDAELFFLLAFFQGADRDASLRAATRASEIDPQYADAWQMLGIGLSATNRLEEALGALDRCVAISPTSVDCRGARANQYRRLGRCAEMEEDLRRAISANPKASLDWYDDRATALYALARPRETVLEALAQKWAQLPADKRRPIELLDRAQLDFDAGQLARAEGLAREGNALLQLDRNALIHAQYAVLLVKIYSETGRPEDAAEVADGYFKRLEVWEVSVLARRLEMLLLRTLFRAGKLSKEAFAKRQAAWFAEMLAARDTDPGRLWFFAHVNGIERPEEAQEALAALSKLPPGAPSQAILHQHRGGIGQMYLLAGRLDDARKLLRPEGQPCSAPGMGYRVSLAFGQAEEQQGDSAAACAAYQVVLDHWGQARPPSVTAQKARARAMALGCAAPRPGAAR
jgi:serine/threonine protein kinase/predicted Zn-dependent protease